MGVVQDLVSKGYGGYAGWGESEAQQDYQKTGGSGKFTGIQSSGSSGGTGGDMNSFFQQQNQLQQQAIQPAIQSLQASIPTIKTNYGNQISQKQNEIQPLQDRYKSLIDQIKGVGQTSVNKQTVVTAGELGKRGIEGSSTLAGQEIANATLPIEQQTQSLVKDTGFAQEADLRDIANTIQNLGGQQTEKEQAIQQAIAQLQAGGGQTAIQNAMSLLANAQNLEASKAASKYQAQQDAIQNALAQQELGLKTKQTNADIANTNSLIAERNKSTTTSTTPAAILQALGIDIGGLQLGTGQNLGVGSGGWQ